MMNRKMLIILAVAAGLLVVLVLPLFIRLDRFRPVIEQHIAQYLPGTVHLEGHLSFGLLPSPHLALKKIRIDNPPAFGPTPLFSLQRLAVRVAFWPLLRRRLQITAIELSDLHLDLVKNKKGLINIAPPAGATGRKAGPSTFARLRAAKMSVHGLIISYKNEESGTAVLLEGGNLQLEDIVLSPGADSLQQILADHLSLQGTLFFKKISEDGREFTDVKLRLANREGRSEIDLVQAGWEGCRLLGKTIVNLRMPSVPVTTDASLLPGKDSGAGATFGLAKQGSLTLHADFDVNPVKQQKLLATLGGKVHLQGKDLLVNGYDLDAVIDQYRKSSNVNLIDIGAYLVAGPLAALVSKGIEVAGFRHGFGDVQTKIVRLGARIDLAGGVASAEDVAFTTAKNRVAIRGKIDLLHRQYRQLQIAVVDAAGCAEVLQTINGPLADPNLGTEQFGLRTLSRPLTSLWKEATKLLGSESCQPFYEGAIPQPSP